MVHESPVTGHQSRLQRAADHGPGAYAGKRLRSQREVIRDVLLAANDCDCWLTLEELRSLTKFGTPSISAQMRFLRKAEYGGFRVVKRIREHLDQAPYPEKRGGFLWEYRILEARGRRLEAGTE